MYAAAVDPHLQRLIRFQVCGEGDGVMRHFVASISAKVSRRISRRADGNAWTECFLHRSRFVVQSIFTQATDCEYDRWWSRLPVAAHAGASFDDQKHHGA